MATYESSDVRTPLLDRRLRWWKGCLLRPCKRFRESLRFVIFRMASYWKTIWDAAKSDPTKVINSFKMSFAMLLGFMLVFLEFPSQQISSHATWAIITIIVIFEYTIGASLSKGCNRGAGTLLAGFLAVGIGQIGRLSNNVCHPILIGLSAFILGGLLTYARLSPSFKPYENGCRTFLVTYSLIMNADYRSGDPFTTATDRFLIILLGAIIGLAVNMLILPCWAGDDLHRNIAKNFRSVADSLEGCVDAYLRGVLLERIPSKILMGLAADDPVYKGYRSALTSSNKEQSLATFASWEPPHGKFRKFNYPWQAYVKVGAVLRHCAYSVVALHGCLRSSIQAPLAVRAIFERELLEVSLEGAKALRKLGRQVENMQKADCSKILNNVQHSVARLWQSLNMHSYLLVRQETGILEDHVQNLCVNVIPEFSRNGNGESALPIGMDGEPQMAHPQDESSNSPGQGLKKLRSWPSRHLDDMDFTEEYVFAEKVKVLETASALSLGTFATLLMDVALRLEYVVEAVEELSCLANFTEEK